MSLDLLNRVRKMDVRPSGRKFVLFALADYADERGSCYPSVATLAKYTAQGEKTVRDHLSALEADGLLGRERTRNKAGQLGQYRYVLTLSDADRNAQERPEAEPAADFASGENFHQPAADFAGHNHQNSNLTVREPSESVRVRATDLGSEAVGIYREVCVPAGLLDCRTLTGSRKTQLHARLKAVGIDVWAEACRKAAASPFLRGENDRGWRAGIDFLVRESSFTKIMEDAYAERTGRTPHTAADRHRAATDIRRAAMLRVAQEASRGHGGGDAGGGNSPGDGGAAGGHLSLAYTRDG